ncbi:collagen alpha-1(III) chain-like [Passer montanus]|uniref:collagen alpha-1(III) chain-like n=1 Tax=Passer montanus TaxID=9160 RepID=UPI00195F5C33|nr:collagen alpha-1(III) chain-like [Passer montanus]
MLEAAGSQLTWQQGNVCGSPGGAGNPAGVPEPPCLSFPTAFGGVPDGKGDPGRSPRAAGGLTAPETAGFWERAPGRAAGDPKTPQQPRWRGNYLQENKGKINSEFKAPRDGAGQGGAPQHPPARGPPGPPAPHSPLRNGEDTKWFGSARPRSGALGPARFGPSAPFSCSRICSGALGQARFDPSARFNPVRLRSGRFGSVRAHSAALGPAQLGSSALLSSIRPHSARFGCARFGSSAQFGPTRPGSVRLGSAGLLRSAQRSPARLGSARPGSAPCRGRAAAAPARPGAARPVPLPSLRSAGPGHAGSCNQTRDCDKKPIKSQTPSLSPS